MFLTPALQICNLNFRLNYMQRFTSIQNSSNSLYLKFSAKNHHSSEAVTMSSSRHKFSLYSTLTEVRKASHKMLNYRTRSRLSKSPFVSMVAFAAILFLVYADNLITNLFEYPAEIRVADIISNSMSVTGQVDTNVDEEPDLPIPPKLTTREKRTEWFRRIAPQLEILNSNELTQEFHGRVQEFFNKQCSIQFFMVWLSPAQSFGPRDFLAADTLFKANPQACLIIISRSLDTQRGYEILKPLLEFGFKVSAITPDLPFLVKDTPAETWLDELKSGKEDPGNIPLSNNLSNLIRLVMLYKYGGVYVDTDFIILKDFTGLRNAVGAQSIDLVTKKWSRLNGAIMIFDMGHPILNDFLQEFATTFDGTKWGHNGPYLVSRVIKRVGEKPGYNLTILPRRAFYPANWNKIVRLFKKPETEEDSKWVEEMTVHLSSISHGVHLWNKRTRELVIEQGSVVEKLIADHCAVCQNNYNS